MSSRIPSPGIVPPYLSPSPIPGGKSLIYPRKRVNTDYKTLDAITGDGSADRGVTSKNNSRDGYEGRLPSEFEKVHDDIERRLRWAEYRAWAVRHRAENGR